MQNSADDVCEIVQPASGFLIAAILSTLSRVSEICQTLSGFFSDGRDSLPLAYEISAIASRNFEARPNQGGALSQALQSAVWKPPFLEMTLRGSRLFQLLENLVKLLGDLRCPLSKLFRRAYNCDAPGTVADFDAAQFLTRFYIDDGDVV